MIIIKDVRNIKGKTQTVTIKSEETRTIDAQGKLTLLPGLIDPHVHFRTPGLEHKENWITGTKAAISGGVTTVFDMPNTLPACSTKKALLEKKQIISKQLAEVGIPLGYHLYFGADKNHLEEIDAVQNEIIGVKVFMGSTTGNLVMDDAKALDRVFKICAQLDLIVSVHAEDEELMQLNQKKYAHITDPSVHSKIRSREVAIKATTQAIALSQKHGTRLCILHLTTKEEVELVRAAKAQGLSVFAETTPHHLFLNENDYARFGTFVQMNPPLRTEADQAALWEGIYSGVIDMIGPTTPRILLRKRNNLTANPLRESLASRLRCRCCSMPITKRN